MRERIQWKSVVTKSIACFDQLFFPCMHFTLVRAKQSVLQQLRTFIILAVMESIYHQLHFASTLQLHNMIALSHMYGLNEVPFPPMNIHVHSFTNPKHNRTAMRSHPQAITSSWIQQIQASFCISLMLPLGSVDNPGKWSPRWWVNTTRNTQKPFNNQLTHSRYFSCASMKYSTVCSLYPNSNQKYAASSQANASSCTNYKNKQRTSEKGHHMTHECIERHVSALHHLTLCLFADAIALS